jgi:excisionase family DNA binding protein
MLDLCRATVYSLVARGDLPHIRVGNAVRFELADLIAALERHRRT